MWLAPSYLRSMRFLVIQHLDIEPPALIGDVLIESGHELCFVHVTKGDSLPEDTRDLAGIIVMGGPQSANDEHLPYIRAELEWLQQAMHKAIPMLGICLGAQLMAKAAGGSISASPLRELGWHPVFPVSAAQKDPLFSSLSESGQTVFQWHGESFSLPDHATLMASHRDVPMQAFRLGKAQYGLQFHIEVDAPLIAQWISAGDSERDHLGEQGIKRLHDESAIHLEAMRKLCRNMVGNWLQQFA